jgi:hypothetical protein
MHYPDFDYPAFWGAKKTMDQTELEFLQDMNALISEALEEGGDPLAALKILANEVRNRIDDLEAR